MKINVNTISDKEVQGTGQVKSMGMSDNVQGIIFQMFTSNIYSNPIGTVVREITSNCFDSHIEADVDKPVIIRLSVDETTEIRYISFIDFGVGMSPERVEEIYTIYFESTKRDNNDEIGGFGIGGKTPLAYKRYTYAGKGEYDNSFFVITKYNGIKYTYSIFEGEKSPQYVLLGTEPTKEHNGTEIKIPVLDSDIYKFETEIIKQLYYFENLVFEGFSDRVTNDYKIYKGENFLYRGNNVSDFAHVCLGRVAYPIDYSILDISKYDYRFPVAINVPIGAINVVASREQLDYSDATIEYLKLKLNEVKQELISLLEKQNNNIVTLNDYITNLKDVLKLRLTNDDDKYIDMSNVINIKDIHLTNYKYKDNYTPSFERLYGLFLKHKRYGAVEKKRYYNEKYSTFNGNLGGLNNKNVFYIENFDDFKINRKLSSYLKDEYGRFYLIMKKDIDSVFDEYDLNYILKTDDPIYVKQMGNDVWDVIKSNVNNIEDVEIPEDYKPATAIPKEKYIPIHFSYYNDKYKVLLKDLVEFKGTIFYDVAENKHYMKSILRIFTAIFDVEHLVLEGDGKSYFTNPKKNIMFITLAKNNVRYLNYCTNANVHHIDDGYLNLKFLRRKEDNLKLIYKTFDIYKDITYNINEVFFMNGFDKVNPDIAKMAKKIKLIQKDMKTIINKYDDIRYNKTTLVDLGMNLDYKYTKEDKIFLKDVELLKNINAKNEKILEYLRLPSYYDLNDTQIYILKKTLKF